MSTEFESIIGELTQPLNGQYPRPWMTVLANPRHAKVFIIGKNQAVEYTVEKVGPHSRHMDSLFNRNGESCRGFYNEVTRGKPSRSRPNIDDLTHRLKRRGVVETLETNVICYSTIIGSHLSKQIHAGGRQRGDEIFRVLLSHIRPPILISHGVDTTRRLGDSLGMELPLPPVQPRDLIITQQNLGSYSPQIFVIPSLAQPAFNSWRFLAPAYLDKVAAEVAARLGKS